MKDYEELFYDEKVKCCEEIPSPLMKVEVTVNKCGRNEHPTHYFPYAFECLKCGAIYEIKMEDFSYTSIGDFMCPNYTSWSVRPSLVYLINNPKYKKELTLLDKELTNSLRVIWNKESKARGAIRERLGKIENRIGDLSEKQYDRARDKYCKPQIAILKQCEDDEKSLTNTYIVKVRELLGLSPISAQYRIAKLNNSNRLRELKTELSSKREKMAEIEKLVATINSQDTIAKEIAQIEAEIKERET